ISTRVLTPLQAVTMAAVLNILGALLTGTAVAATIGKGVIDPAAATLPVIASALVGAIAWNLITWYYGLPSSSSHALVGGLAGAGIAHGGLAVLNLGFHMKGLVMIAAFIIIAPMLGMLLGYLFMVATYWIFRRATPARVSGLFRQLQLMSAAMYSLGHGGNDAQKTMGIIFAVLIASSQLPSDAEVPFWVVISCHVAMGVGTLFGGWRIVKTMGHKICKLQPVHGFSAETAGATTLYLATAFGIPVSTTHTITGAIVGVGSTRGFHAVKWGVAGRVVWAWILTIPASALIAMLTWQGLCRLG
ncbi:MAG: inorganic phosphate transporter, partial [Planctomycetes bacterium]|nr:inorganic phosphate transporter [Planctomycetota bacterium]